MFRKTLITLIVLIMVFSPLGNIPAKKAQASEKYDALIEAVLKAAASALAQALADALTKEETSDAKSEGEEQTANQKAAAEQQNQVPTKDVTTAKQAARAAAEAAAQKDQTFWQWAEEFVQTVLQKAILDVVVDQIITYIQGGGKPQFVTDWKGFAENAAQRAGGEFVESLGLGFLCEPFSLQLQIALGEGTAKKFSDTNACTIDKIVSNIENFKDDFRDGGWIAYGESWKIQNNFVGSYIEASKQKGFREQAAAVAALNEAVSGKGFTSAKKCKQDAKGKDIQSTCKVVTPGSTLGDLTSKSLGSDIDFLLNAEQLGDYVGAIVDALLNRIIEEGLAEAHD